MTKSRSSEPTVVTNLVNIILDRSSLSKTLQWKLFFYFPYVCKLARWHPGSSSCHSPAHTGPAGWRRAAGTVGTGRDRRTARSDRRSLEEGEEKRKAQRETVDGRAGFLRRLRGFAEEMWKLYQHYLMHILLLLRLIALLYYLATIKDSGRSRLSTAFKLIYCFNKRRRKKNRAHFSGRQLGNLGHCNVQQRIKKQHLVLR